MKFPGQYGEEPAMRLSKALEEMETFYDHIGHIILYLLRFIIGA